MGFCRRCGDIVSGPRCKCGGLAVRASVDFSQTASSCAKPDLWSRTYVRSSSASSVPSPIRERSTTLPASTSRPFTDSHKYPRPQSTHFSRSTLGDPVLSHVESVLSHPSLTPTRTDSQKKDSMGEPPSPPDDILSDPNTAMLSKAYGSVLQPKESLSIFTCFVCSTPFSPDATIYPDPNDPTATTRFLCKACFTMNGGAKGDCASCAKSVLILSSEGGFIENAGCIWHKRCFRCNGCFKDISDNPLVDLLGRPSCEDCFDTCLKRPRSDSIDSRRAFSTPDNSEERSNPGGMKRGASREGSPTIEELQQRLGIKSREPSPFVERASSNKPDRNSSPISSDLNRRLSELSARATSLTSSLSEEWPPKASDANPKGRYEKFRLSPSKSPTKASGIHSPSPRAESNAIEEMERRLQRQLFVSSPSVRSISPTTTVSRDSISGSLSMLDLTDGSDCNTAFSPPSTPASSPPEQHDSFAEKTPTKPVSPLTSMSPTMIALSTPSTPCSKCSKPLFRTRAGGKFVTVPEESSKHLPPKSYHAECFRCAVCDEPFEETKSGQAVFVRSSTGCCHVGCVTPERIIIRPIKAKASSLSLASSPTKQDRQPSTAPPMIGSFPRFGSGVTCSGCHISVSPMERGVVPGPQGSRWHASCLVCGGRGSRTGARRDPITPGCGKRLDSAAKSDGEGGVWCRECLLLVDSPTRQESTVRPLEPSYTGGNAFNRFPATSTRKNEGIVPQFTGTTTIARQFTGMGGLTSQLTGSGLNPTRQLPRDYNRSPSPTKGFVLSNSIEGGRRVPFPRPKSGCGVRGKSTSVDEGRGMFLVRQLTGSGGGELRP